VFKVSELFSDCEDLKFVYVFFFARLIVTYCVWYRHLQILLKTVMGVKQRLLVWDGTGDHHLSSCLYYLLLRETLFPVIFKWISKQHKCDMFFFLTFSITFFWFSLIGFVMCRRREEHVNDSLTTSYYLQRLQNLPPFGQILPLIVWTHSMSYFKDDCVGKWVECTFLKANCYRNEMELHTTDRTRVQFLDEHDTRVQNRLK
jgi:hypothetical protein